MREPQKTGARPPIRRAFSFRTGFGAFLNRGMVCAVLATALVLCAPAGEAPVRASSKTELISLYLYNFLLFVDWPAGNPRSPQTIEIGFLGREGGEGCLLTEIAGKQIRRRTLVIRRIHRTADLDRSLQVLFVQDDSKNVILEALARLEQTPCLTVSNMPGFTDLGGMVEILPPPSDGSLQPHAGAAPSPVRFRINLDAVLDAGLKIRSRLLRLSEIKGDIPHGTSIEK
ncbi:MAG: YfiR family protein [Deltaproteobacteria bacterium]|nr:YfiR family protein [Deltaproteobacteria bacterium]